jgi:hypothetical protein
MEEIGILCDHRFNALSSEPGGQELLSFHYVIADDSGDVTAFQGENGLISQQSPFTISSVIVSVSACEYPPPKKLPFLAHAFFMMLFHLIFEF